MRLSSIVSLFLIAGVSLLLALLLGQPQRRTPPSPVIVGEIRGEHGLLMGATVRCKGSADSVLSDRTGQFRLPRISLSSDRITAWKDGYFIAGVARNADPLRFQLHRLPTADNREYEWVDPAPDPRGQHNCANCHQEIYREWNESGHGRSATGRQFRDLYTGDGGGWGLLVQHPDGRGVCSACHAPTIKAGDPALLRLDKVSGVAAKGVHCDYCHKINGIGDDEIGLAHGRDLLTLLRPEHGQLFFGPLDDVDRGEDAYSAFYKDSRYCAACHEGTVFGVHVYSTYSEWRGSPAGRNGIHCQECHTKPTGKLTNIAPGNGGIERDPMTLGNHRFFDGSREQMLKRCVRVSLERDGDQFTVAIRVEGVGHRVPTGFIDRHLLLVVEARDGRGMPIEVTLGPRLPTAAGTELVGKAGLLFAKLLKNEDGKSPAPFWKALPEEHDTRLHPDRIERSTHRFARPPQSIRVRLIHRRFWAEVERQKGWPPSDLIIFEREWSNFGL